MSAKWIPTAHKGLRYYEHENRKHGKKKDRYYAVRFRRDGKLYEYGIGWWSEGIPEEAKKNDPDMGFEEYCLTQMKLYKTNIRDGSGPKSPKEKREIAAETEIRKAEQEKAEQERQEQENLTFEDVFTKEYFPIAKQNKTKRAWATEESLYKLWIYPTIGKLPLKSVAPIHLEKIKKVMADAGRSPRSIAYVLSLIRQVYNFSRRHGLYDGAWPGADKAVKIPKKDNRRQRFLTHEEAEALLAALKEKSRDVYDMSLLALHCGLRASEIFSLTWGDVDTEKETLLIKDPKNKRNRYAFMTGAVKAMLEGKAAGVKSELVFKARATDEDGKKKQVDRISKTFSRMVDSLKLNEGIDDDRQKVVFHSLRHTFASWLVQDGVDLYTVKELMGHERIDMTGRYSHLSPTALRNAVKTLENGIARQSEQQQAGKVVNFQK